MESNMGILVVHTLDYLPSRSLFEEFSLSDNGFCSRPLSDSYIDHIGFDPVFRR